MSKKKPNSGYYKGKGWPRRDLPVKVGATDEAQARNYAAAYLAPETAAARAVAPTVPLQLREPVDIPALCDEIRARATEVAGGDTSRLEAMLFGQSEALQFLWVWLLEKAMVQEQSVHHDALMRLALRAQAQSRASIETLMLAKNPQTIIARQANVTSGPQQINNNLDLSRARESLIPPTQLSRGANAVHPDSRASSDAGRDDSQLEAVAEVHGAKDTRR